MKFLQVGKKKIFRCVEYNSYVIPLKSAFQGLYYGTTHISFECRKKIWYEDKKQASNKYSTISEEMLEQ